MAPHVRCLCQHTAKRGTWKKTRYMEKIQYFYSIFNGLQNAPAGLPVRAPFRWFRLSC
jgi:hypothetical protein